MKSAKSEELSYQYSTPVIHIILISLITYDSCLSFAYISFCCGNKFRFILYLFIYMHLQSINIVYHERKEGADVHVNLKKKEGKGIGRGEREGGVGEGEGECDLYPECQNDGNSPLGIPPGQSAGKILENLAHRFRPFALLEICGIAHAHSWSCF
jgi:hypothetical protein